MSDTASHPHPNLFATLVPVRAWKGSSMLRQKHVALFAALVGYPLVAMWIYGHEARPVRVSADGTYLVAPLIHDLKWLDWPFVAYFGVVWLIGMWLIIKPRLTWRPMATTTLIAIVSGGSVAVWLEGKFHAQTGNLLSAIFAVGGSEEFAKLLAVLATIAVVAKLWPARRAEIFDASPKSFLYLGAISGVVFGCAEAVEYIVISQQVAFNGHDRGVGLTQMIFLRLISDPINHAMWAAITGFFVGLAVQRARRANRMTLSGVLEQSWLIGVGLAITATLHGLHDFFSNTGLVDVIIDVTSVLLMLGYALAGDVVEKALADTPSPLRRAKVHAGRPAQPAPATQWSPPAPYYAAPQYGPPVQPWSAPDQHAAAAAPMPLAPPVTHPLWAPTRPAPMPSAPGSMSADGYPAARP